MKCLRPLYSSVFRIMLLVVLIAGLISACDTSTDATTMASETSTTLLPPTATSTVTSSPSPTITSTLPPTATATKTNTPEPTSTSTPVCLRILNPPDGTQYPELGEVRFEWEEVQGAVKYRLEMVTPMDTTIVFETFLTTVNRYLIMYPWGGTYSWKITALGSDAKAICAAGPYSFTKLTYAPTAKPENSKSEKWLPAECG